MSNNYDTLHTLLVWDGGLRGWWPRFSSYSEDLAYEQGEAMTEELSYFDSTWCVIATPGGLGDVDAEVQRLNNLVEV